jgi:biopolymer transport protein ExbD
LIVSITPSGRLYLNKEQLDKQQLGLRLTEILKNRRDKTVFFSADDAVTYGDVAAVMDLVRTAGAKNLGIVLETVPVEGVAAAPPPPEAPAPAQ